MMFDVLQSRSTLQSWQSYRPIRFLLVNFAAGLVSLIVAIPINFISSANAPDNDYSKDSGWMLMMPIPCIGIVWSLVDMFICRYGCLHPIYALVSAILIAIGYVTTGILTILLYDWDSTAWVPGVFYLLNFFIYCVYIGYAARAIHLGKKRSKSDARVSGLQQA